MPLSFWLRTAIRVIFAGKVARAQCVHQAIGRQRKRYRLAQQSATAPRCHLAYETADRALTAVRQCVRILSRLHVNSVTRHFTQLALTAVAIAHLAFRCRARQQFHSLCFLWLFRRRLCLKLLKRCPLSSFSSVKKRIAERVKLLLSGTGVCGITISIKR